MAQADVVFSGTVTAFYDQASESRLRSTADPIVYTFEVTAIWKGRAVTTMKVVRQRDGCAIGENFEVGRSYLVYASSEPDLEAGEPGLRGWGLLSPEDAARGIVRVSNCSRTNALDKVADDLAALPAPLGAAAPLPELLAGLQADDEKSRLAAMNAVARLANDAVLSVLPAFERFLAGSEAEAMTLVHMLERSAPDDERAERLLTRALGHGSPIVRWASARALGQTRHADAGTMRALVAGLSDREYAVRYECAQALGRFGPAAAPAVPALVRALDDEASPVQCVAAEALGAIGFAAREAVPALATMLGVDDGGCPQVAQALSTMGDVGLCPLYAALAEGNERARRQAAGALAAMKVPPGDAVVALLPLLEDPDVTARLGAAEALARSEQGQEAGMSTIIALLEHGSEYEISLATSVLCRLGPLGQAAEPVLVRLLAVRESRAAAARALGTVGSTRDETLAALESVLLDSESDPYAYEASRQAIERLLSASERH